MWACWTLALVGGRLGWGIERKCSRIGRIFAEGCQLVEYVDLPCQLFPLK
jgi:hypothetical protein